MKRYELKCPKCQDDNICIDLALPEEPFCKSCQEDIDIDEIREFISGWAEFIKDIDDLLEAEKKAGK